MAVIKWSTTRPDHEKLVRIAERYERLSPKRFSGDDWRALLMDITACHLNGCPLDLDKLLSAPDFDFVHDISGIQRHIDRDTAGLARCFVPRCAQKTQDGEKL